MQAPLLLVPHRSSAEIQMTDLSDQTLMEALIEQTSDEFKQPFQHPSGRYLPVCRWSGVKCNGRRQVMEIVRHEFPVKDTHDRLHIAFLPRHIKSCCLPEGGDFFGTVPTQALPNSLESLDIRNNSFNGTFDFSRLPARMERVNIRKNNFSGSCDLTRLPKHLVELDAFDTLLSGSIALHTLPKSLRYLYLKAAHFRGTINLRNLPPSLTLAFLRESSFFGKICLDYLPKCIGVLNLSHNRLCGPVQAAKLPSSLQRLDLRFNEFTGVAVINIDMLPRVVYDSEYITAIANSNGKIYKQMPQGFDDLPHMMAFIDGLDGDTKRMFLKRNGDPLPLKLWKGFKFDSFMQVTHIKVTEDTGFKNLKGKFDFDKLPRMIRAVEIAGYGKYLNGHIVTEHLPKVLEDLRVPNNSMEGDFRFGKLPMSLITLDVSQNLFSGPVALDLLPIHMESLAGSRNNFGGTLDLANLPRTLRVLRLCGCGFTEEVNLNLLPAGLEELDLSHNRLDGKVRMTRVPPSLRHLSIDGNNFQGTAVISRDAPSGWSLKISPKIQAIVDTNNVPYSDY